MSPPTSKTFPNMKSLPNEIWANIISYFEFQLSADQWNMYGAQLDRSPYKALTSLCLVSQRSYLITQPLLYRTIILNNDNKDDQFNRLAMTLVSKPSLGRFIHAISLGTGLRQLSQPELVHKALKDELELPSILRERFRKNMKRVAEHERDDRLIAVLITFMPNLQLFEQTLGGWSRLLVNILSGRIDLEEKRGRIPASIRDEEIGQLSNFGMPHLKELRLRSPHHREDTTPICEVEAIFLHPRIKTLRLQGFDWTRLETQELQHYEYRNYSIETLELKESLIDTVGLRDVLNRFKALRVLIIEIGDLLRSMRGDELNNYDLNLGQFGEILREYGTNLVELDLETSDYGYADEYIGSLRELRSLRCLKISQEDLVSRWYERESEPEWTRIPLSTVLPSSIETLLFYNQMGWLRQDCDDERIRELRELATSGEFPNLRSIEVELLHNQATCRSPLLEEPLDGWKISVAERITEEKYMSTNPILTGIFFCKVEREC